MDYRVNVPEGESGGWAVQRFKIEDDMRLWRLKMDGRDGGMKAGQIYTRLIRTDTRWANPMMSDTPMEVRDHLYAIGHMAGRVLINGLGIGMVLKAALARPSVTHIDVVEIDEDIINLVWPTYADDPRATLHHDDALTIKWPTGTRWDVAWHDIWPTICTDNIETMSKLHRRYGRRTNWQGSWQRGEIQYYARRDRDAPRNRS